MKRFLKDVFTLKLGSRKGQGMTEYIIIVALVAIAAIAIVTLFGNQIRGMFKHAGDRLAGKQERRVDEMRGAEREVKKALDRW